MKTLTAARPTSRGVKNERLAQERTILQRIAAGDEDAVAECFDKYGGLVLSLARRYLGRTGDDVEDGVQDVFIALWQCADRFDPQRGTEVAFVATVAHRKLIDQCRKNGKARKALANFQREREGDPGDRSDIPSRGESAGEVEVALSQLSEEVRETLTLSVCRGLSYPNIAAATGAPTGTIKSRANRGLLRLRERLGAFDHCARPARFTPAGA